MVFWLFHFYGTFSYFMFMTENAACFVTAKADRNAFSSYLVKKKTFVFFHYRKCLLIFPLRSFYPRETLT